MRGGSVVDLDVAEVERDDDPVFEKSGHKLALVKTTVGLTDLSADRFADRGKTEKNRFFSAT